MVIVQRRLGETEWGWGMGNGGGEWGVGNGVCRDRSRFVVVHIPVDKEKGVIIN